MDYTTYSIVSLIISVLLISLAMFSYLKGFFAKCLMCIMLLGLVFRIFSSSDNYLHQWDEQYHAVVAKNCAMHPLKPTLYENPVLPYNYKEWYSNNVWLHKPPLTLWVLASSITIFGNTLFAIRFPSILFSILSIYFCYVIAEKLFNKRVGLLAAYFVSIHSMLIELASGRAGSDHVDTLFIFWMLMGIVLILKFLQTQKNVYNILLALCIGLAVLTKWLPAYLLLVLWMIAVFKTVPLKTFLLYLLEIALISIVIFLPWQLFIFYQYPLEASWESYYNSLHIFNALEGHDGNIFYYFEKLRIMMGEGVFIVLLFFLVITIKKKNRKFVFISAWFWIPYLFFSIVKTKMPAYPLIGIPALFIMTGYFISALPKSYNPPINKYIKVVVILFLITMPLRYCFERERFLKNPQQDMSWQKNLEALQKNGSDDLVLFNFKKNIEAMYYVDFPVYRNIPNSYEIDSLLAKNYTLLINNPPDVTTFPSNSKVIFLYLNDK